MWISIKVININSQKIYRQKKEFKKEKKRKSSITNYMHSSNGFKAIKQQATKPTTTTTTKPREQKPKLHE